jgi:SAM-dependent methyltransferase
MFAGSHSIDDLRGRLEPLPWADRFEMLAAAEAASDKADRREIAALRSELAARCLAEISGEWGGVPLKEGILRLPSKRMRGALGRAAKEARDARIVEVMAMTSDPLAGPVGADRPYGIGLDERVVEIPMALRVARLWEPGDVLDAGAALNLPVVRRVVGRPRARLTHVTIAADAEQRLHTDGGRFICALGDLRRMPFRNGTFDRAVCVSTLEHVGMDNARYGATAESNPDTASAAVAELIRVLKRGGDLLITVPYGRAADHGWFRVLDEAGLDVLLAPARSELMTTRFFYYASGWIEGDATPPASVVEAQYTADVITGVAIVSIRKREAL